MRAMVLLGLNAGFGNTDVASLPQSALNLKTGWITFPRSKTGIQRRIPLWPETVAELKAAIAVRPSPADPADDGLVFLTERGTRFVRLQPSRTKENHTATINAVARRFEKLLKTLGMAGNKGRNFYSLRHVFETVAGECADQVAVDAIMGHADPSMGANYRHGISDDRLRKAVGTVRSWLWPEVADRPVKATKDRKGDA
jgi:integrase